MDTINAVIIWIIYKIIYSLESLQQLLLLVTKSDKLSFIICF